MIIKKKDRIKHENSRQCIAYEYPIDDRDINIAFVEIDGRYPDKGYAINKKVKELVFVLDGSGLITIEKDVYKLEKGDVVLILPNTKFFWNGKLKVLASCAPAWSMEQYRRFE